MEDKILELQEELKAEKEKAKKRAEKIRERIKAEKKRQRQEARKKENHNKILAGVLSFKLENLQREQDGEQPLTLEEFVNLLNSEIKEIEKQKTQTQENSNQPKFFINN